MLFKPLSFKFFKCLLIFKAKTLILEPNKAGYNILMKFIYTALVQKFNKHSKKKIISFYYFLLANCDFMAKFGSLSYHTTANQLHTHNPGLILKMN